MFRNRLTPNVQRLRYYTRLVDRSQCNEKSWRKFRRNDLFSACADDLRVLGGLSVAG